MADALQKLSAMSMRVFNRRSGVRDFLAYATAAPGTSPRNVLLLMLQQKTPTDIQPDPNGNIHLVGYDNELKTQSQNFSAKAVAQKPPVSMHTLCRALNYKPSADPTVVAQQVHMALVHHARQEIAKAECRPIQTPDVIFEAQAQAYATARLLGVPMDGARSSQFTTLLDKPEYASWAANVEQGALLSKLARACRRAERDEPVLRQRVSQIEQAVEVAPQKAQPITKPVQPVPGASKALQER